MKKRFTALFLALVMLFTVTACSPNFKAYMDKTKEVNNWAGAEGVGTGEVAVSFKDDESKKDINIKIPVSVTTKSEGKDKAEVKLVYDFTALKNLVAQEEPDALKDFPFQDKLELKMFVDVSDPNNTRMIMDKGFFKAMTVGEENEFLDSIKEEYIELPTDTNMGLNKKAIAYLNSAEFESDLINFAETAFKGFEAKNDIKVDGNKFSYQADVDQLTDDGINALVAMSKNWDSAKTILADILTKAGAPVTVEDLDVDFSKFNEEEAKEQVNQIKETLKGSEVKIDTVFDKDKVIQDAKFDINVENDFKMNIKVNSETKKNESIKVTMPRSVKKLSQDEYIQLTMPNQEPVIFVTINGDAVDFPDQEPVIVNDRTLVPFRALLEQMGATDITWDEVNRTVRAKHGDKAIALEIDNKVAIVGDKKVELDVPAQIIGDRTVVPLRFISENFGYTVKFEKASPIFYTIEVNNMSDEEIEKKQEAQFKELEKEMKTEDKEKSKESAASVGIIGGADGPTSIFTKTK